ncbi:unnamed protein product [Cuscuta epithymum]|nr:unnamed protein product [Cuscuta epithymum]
MDVKERVCPLPSLFFPFFSFPLLLLIGLLLLVCGLSDCNPKPVIFNFGDSNSDTGTYFIMHGRISQISQTLAQSLSIQTQGRMSDGQLVLDFFCESLNAHYLSPFLESIDANFTNGVNFAMSGSSIAPTSVFFSLQNQVAHFSRFKRRSLDFVSKGDKDLLGNEDFENAIYVIDIGQNDIDAAFSSQSYVVAVQRIPFFISEIENAMWVLYQQGARKFWVHNTGPLGCLPKTLTSSNFPANDLDQHGCVTSFNSGAQLFNEGLRRLRDKLAHEMKDAIIVYVDIYAIKYDLIANSSVYG